MIRPSLVLLALAAQVPLAGADPKDVARAEALNEEGKARIQVVDFEGAAERFRAAIALVPDPRYYYNLCYTLDRAGDLREARSACEVAASGSNARLADKARERLLEINKALLEGKDGRLAAPGDAPRPGDTLADGEAVEAAPTAAAPAGGEPVEAAPTAAAPTARPRNTYSFRLGAGASTIVGDFDLDYRPAFALGGGAVIWFGKVGLQLEALLARRGASQSFADGSPTRTDTYTMLDVVTAARLETARGRVRPYGLAGLYLGASLDVKGELADGSAVDVGDTSAVDLGFVVGAGAVLGGLRRAFSLDLRFQQGLTNIAVDADFTVRHRVVLLVAGYEL